MKKKILIISGLIGIVVFLIILGVFIATHDISISAKVDNRKEFFVKNGYRYKYEKVPENFVMPLDEYDNTRTIRFALFRLYELQKLSPDTRVKNFEDIEKRANMLKTIDWFTDNGIQYKLADNFCIDQIKGGEFSEVNCESRAIPIEKLPYERCKYFEKGDSDGVYYTSYNIKTLWKEFDKQGIDDIYKQIEKERQELIQKAPEFASYY